MSSMNSDKMSSELRRVRYLGSAHSGTTGAWHMRLTSLALLPLTIGFTVLVLSLVGKDYASARATLSHPVAALLMLLFVGTSIYHMHLGMRTIIEDYVHGAHLKDLALAASLFFSIVIGLTCVFAVLRLSLV